MSTFMVHTKFRPSIGAERAFRMVCSFEDPLGETIFDDTRLMTGTVVGSTPEGVAHRVKEELLDAGAENLSVVVKEEEAA